jgi:thiamine biosynthesis lipoprotein
MLMKDQKSATRTHFAMNTVMSHKVFGIYAEDCLDAVCREISQLEGLLSRFIPNSDVSQINQSAGRSCVVVDSKTFEVLTRSKELASLCSGYFNVTIAPLVALWNIGKDSFTHPSNDDIQQKLSLVNYRDLILDSDTQTAGLAKIGQSLDLGAIGKGFAADQIVKIINIFGITSAYSNLGGNVVTLGSKPDGSPWHIGIQHPRQEKTLLGSVAVTNQSVVTSGDYQRFSSDSSGTLFNHIIDPTTGYPVESGLVSVTIISDNAMTADVLSTALFVMGINRGMELLMSFPKTEAILMDTEEKVFVSKGLKGQFQPNENILYTILE